MAKKKRTYFYRDFNGRLLVFDKARSVGRVSHFYCLRCTNKKPAGSDVVFNANDCTFDHDYCYLSRLPYRIVCSRKAFSEGAEKNYSENSSINPRVISDISDFLDAIKISKKLDGFEQISLFDDFVVASKKKSGFLDSFFAKEDDKDVFYYFRGVTNCIYPEKAGIFRKDFSRSENAFYRELLIREPSVFLGKKAIEILTDMQHYELPTRLLDVSSNPLVALYMACSQLYCRPGEWDSTDGEIIAYRADKNEVLYSDSDRAKLLACLPLLRKEEKDTLTTLILANDTSSEKYQTIIERLVSFVRQWDSSFRNDVKATDLMKSYFVRTPLINARIAAQQGAFILQGLDEDYIGKTLKSTRSVSGPRLIVPAKDKKSILAELLAIGINDATMFPDLDHISRFLKNNRP